MFVVIVQLVLVVSVVVVASLLLEEDKMCLLPALANHTSTKERKTLMLEGNRERERGEGSHIKLTGVILRAKISGERCGLSVIF